MQARDRDVLALAIFVGLASAAMAQASAILSKKATGATSADAMVTTAQTKGYVRVIVLFDSPVPPDAIRPDAASIANITSQVAAARNPILATHFGSANNPAPGRGFPRSVTSFPITPGFAVNVNAQELEALAADPRILTIQHDRLEPPTLNESVPLIGAPAAYAAGATGNRQTVAVLDTGVKSTHEFLNGKVIAEACFSNAGGGGSEVSLCPNGSTSQTGTGAADANATNCNNAAAPSTNFNLCYHGTHVAGIAAGFNTSVSPGEPPNGVAKWSKIFAIQVFTRFNDSTSCGSVTPPCVLSYTSDMISALNYVYSNLNPGGYPVASVNMSIGGGLYTGTCDSDTRKPIIDNLRSAGVLTAIAAGNNGSRSQINAPGCISTAFTVGSTSKSDVISSFSNMSSVVDVLGPGGESGGSCTFTGSPAIVAPVVTNGGSTNTYGCLIGTSMATPHVAGAIAEIKSAYPAATAAQIETALINTGLPVADTRSGGTQTKPRIRLDRGVQQAWWTWSIAGVGDFNGDGKADILWRNVDGTVAIWLMNGGTIVASAGVGGAGLDWTIAGVGDFNGDGKADILWRNVDGTVAIWLMNGLSVSSSFGFSTVNTNWFVASVGDFNGDGKSDILWRNNSDGTVAIWLMNGGSVQSSFNLGLVPTAWSIVGVRDFNGDGRADILWRNADGTVATWQMNGGSVQSSFNLGNVP